MDSAAGRGWIQSIRSWFDNAALPDPEDGTSGATVDWARVVPFLFLHAGCLAVFWVGLSPIAGVAAILLYLVRAFFVTAFYHRYFSHRTFQTSRAGQLVFAILGNSAVQRGPLWWAAQHRIHHKHADREPDPHSPHQRGLYWSHMGWLTARENHRTDLTMVRDLAVFPELRWLDRFDAAVPLVYAAGLFGIGAALERWLPGLGTNGPQLLVWGFFVSTVLLFHVTCLVNSAAHTFGRRRFDTGDQSRNNWVVALLTLGEGWHNNHHFFPASVRQGFYWWELDLTYIVLRLLARIGLIWELNPVPARVLELGRGRGRRRA